jgi:hypothetical protein
MVDLSDLYRTMDVEVLAHLPDEIESVEISLEYGTRRVSLSLRARGEPARVRWPYDPSLGRHYRYHYEARFKPEAPAWAGAGRLSHTGTADTTTLLIDPRHLYPPDTPG